MQTLIVSLLLGAAGKFLTPTTIGYFLKAVAALGKIVAARTNTTVDDKFWDFVGTELQKHPDAVEWIESMIIAKIKGNPLPPLPVVGPDGKVTPVVVDNNDVPPPQRGLIRRIGGAVWRLVY